MPEKTGARKASCPCPGTPRGQTLHINEKYFDAAAELHSTRDYRLRKKREKWTIKMKKIQENLTDLLTTAEHAFEMLRKPSATFR